MRLPNGEEFVGTGYAERLDMTLAPWALPFEELRWGRFIGPSRSAVWIYWRGGLERRWAFVDSSAVQAREIGLHGVQWIAGAIEIETGRPVREGFVGGSTTPWRRTCVANVAIGLLLLRLWTIGAPLWFVTGSYLPGTQDCRCLSNLTS